MWRSTLPYVSPCYSSDLLFVASSSRTERVTAIPKLDNMLSYAHARGEALTSHSLPARVAPNTLSSTTTTITAPTPSQPALSGSVSWRDVHVTNTIAGSESGAMKMQFSLSASVRPVDWIQIVVCGFTCDPASLEVSSTVRLKQNPDVETKVECNM